MSWLQDWQEQIYRNFLTDEALHLILNGFQNTIVIFFWGAIWALLLAAFLTYLYINHKWQWLYRPLHWFVATIHDVPAVVLMMFFYYVVFSASLDGILVSIIALGVYTSGTLTKIFKIHIQQVGKEQYEAGRMLGFTPKQIYRLIILPQAVKSMLPLVVGEMKVLLRATSYAGYIAQKDLVKAVDSIRTQTEDVFLPLLFISLLYLFLSWLIGKIFHLLHVKFFCYD
ncbi:MAG: ABC transporter permease subunit [Bacteroidaceae bacterium]|nr:ABC transporter permease subunit [Bacteroidaceae bacterium]